MTGLPFDRWFSESATWQGSDYPWLNRFRDLYAAAQMEDISRDLAAACGMTLDEGRAAVERATRARLGGEAGKEKP